MAALDIIDVVEAVLAQLISSDRRSVARLCRVSKTWQLVGQRILRRWAVRALQGPLRKRDPRVSFLVKVIRSGFWAAIHVDFGPDVGRCVIAGEGNGNWVVQPTRGCYWRGTSAMVVNWLLCQVDSLSPPPPVSP